MENYQIKLARKYLKLKLIEDNVTFRGHEEQRTHLFDLILRTVESGESNSAIVIGPRGAGKTTMLNNVLYELSSNPGFRDNCILVKLNGYLQTDDKLALKSITTQMALDNAVGDKVFGSFSENLAFLLSCLKSGKDKHCKSIVFILDEFDAFCYAHGSQTLLYNLFDIAQSKQAPICVIGLTCRLDVVELLEKRVKSRFSHRQIFIFPNETENVHSDDESVDLQFENRMRLFVSLLSLPEEVKVSPVKKKSKSKKSQNSMETDAPSDSEEGSKVEEIPVGILKKCHYTIREFNELDPIFVSFWNENIVALSRENDVVNCIRRMYDTDIDVQTFKTFLIQVVCRLNENHPQLEPSDFLGVSQKFCHADDRISLLTSLSILELSLMIAMKHQFDIFDGQPMNFEMILNRYTKFANCHSSSQSVPRAVILKAFEHIRSLELISPIKEGGIAGYAQKEFQMYKLLVTPSQINEAIKLYKALPTELIQWASSSLI